MAGIKHLLFKPKWQSKDTRVRKRAVTEDNDPDLLAQLPEIARTDPDPGVRLSASRRLTDIYHLMRIAEADSDEQVRESAQRAWLTMLASPSDQGLPLPERLEIARKLDQIDQLEFLLQRSQEPELRLAVLPRIHKQGLLGDLALSDPAEAVRDQAVSQISQKSTLERVAKIARKKNKRLYKQLTARIAAIEPATAATDAKQALALCQQTEALSRDVGSRADKRQQLSELVEQWRLIKPPADLVARFDGAKAILEQTLAAPLDVAQPNTASSATTNTPESAASALPSESSAEPGATEASVATPVGDRRLDQLVERARAAANKPNSDDKILRRLRADWQRVWTKSNQSDPVAQQQHDHFEGEMGKLTENIQKQAKRKDEALANIDQQLEAVEQALDAGDLSKSVAAVHRFNQSHRLIGQHRHTGSAGFKARMNAVRNRLHELRDWQHWANNKIRQRLCEEADGVLAMNLHPDALAEKIKALQAQWKQLDQSEQLPGDKPNRNPAPRLQRRFRASCNSAFKPAKQFFNKRAEVRDKHLAEVEALISELQETTQQAQPDLSTSEKLVGIARGTLRKLDAVPPKHRGRVARQLRESANLLDEKLEDQYQIVERRKQKIIEEVVALADEADLSKAIDQAKAAQQSWQQAGRTRRNREQKLWKQYRAAADAVFNRLGEQRKEQQAARSADRDALKAVISQVDELLSRQGDALEQAVNELPRLLDTWRQTGASDKGLETQFQQRCQDLRDAGRKLAKQRALDEREVARELHQLCRQAEQQLLRGDAIDRATLSTRWEADSSARSLPKSLQDRFERIISWASALPDNTELESLTKQAVEALQQNCIEMEFLAGVETPGPFKQERMNYQVTRLASRMGGGETDPPNVQAEKLEASWLACGPLPAEQSDALDERFRRALAAYEASV